MLSSLRKCLANMQLRNYVGDACTARSVLNKSSIGFWLLLHQHDHDHTVCGFLYYLFKRLLDTRFSGSDFTSQLAELAYDAGL